MARTPAFGKVVLGTDGSRHARRAVEFLARLAHPGGRVRVVRVVEPVRPPSLTLMPASARARIAGELARLDRAERRQAQRSLDVASTALASAGWRVRTSLRSGVPLRELLAAANEERADLLVIGSRGAGGLARLLLGSVAEGCVQQAPMPVLVVK
jgi:nucleotide-binding universal stress UspA family protein